MKDPVQVISSSLVLLTMLVRTMREAPGCVFGSKATEGKTARKKGIDYVAE